MRYWITGCLLYAAVCSTALAFGNNDINMIGEATWAHATTEQCTSKDKMFDIIDQRGATPVAKYDYDDGVQKIDIYDARNDKGEWFIYKIYDDKIGCLVLAGSTNHALDNHFGDYSNFGKF